MLVKTGETKENCKSEHLPPKNSPVAHVGGGWPPAPPGVGRYRRSAAGSVIRMTEGSQNQNHIYTTFKYHFPIPLSCNQKKVKYR